MFKQELVLCLEENSEHNLIDVIEAERHLALNGIQANDPVILCAYGTTNRFVPDRIGGGDIPYDWDEVTAQAANCVRDYEALRRHLTNPDGKTLNLGYISCPGGTATKKRQEIKEGRVLFVEIDDPKLDKEFQAGIYKSANLPEPTYQLDTGNKSIWHCWVLDQPVSVDLIREGRARLSKAFEDASGIKTDHALHSPHQPARLAGGIHPKTGRRSVLINVTGKWYDFNDLMAFCPEINVNLIAKEHDKLFRDDEEGDILHPGCYPEPAELDQPVPLLLALSAKTRALIHDGQEPGERKGRAITAYQLSKSLQEAQAQLHELGYRVEGDPLEFFKTFCRNSDLLGNGEIGECIRRHYADAADIRCGELSKMALLRSIAKWAQENNYWKYRTSWGRHKNCSGNSLAKDNIRHLKDKSLTHKLAFFEKYVKRIVRLYRNTFRRLVYLREVVKKLSLTQHIKDKEMLEKMLEAQQEQIGGCYQARSSLDRLAMDRPEVRWLIPGVIPQGDLTFIGGRPKVGKTLLTIYLIRCLLTGESWLGFPSTGDNHTVILVSDDQSDADTAAMLERQGLWTHERLLWSSSFRMSEQQLDFLLNDIRSNPGAVVVIDSLRSVTRGMTSNENDANLGVMLYDIKTAVMAAGGTLILIHHCSKTNDLVGIEALSGHNSIPGAGNSVITLHHLPKKDGKGEQKGIPERRFFREGRSGGETPDLVVSIGPAGGFTRLNGFEEFLEKQQESENDYKLRSQIVIVQDAFIKLLEQHNLELNGITTLDLLRSVGGCDQSVQIKADLDNDTKFKSLERKLKYFEKAGLVQHEPLRGNFSGSSFKQLWSLTDRGVLVVKSELA